MKKTFLYFTFLFLSINLFGQVPFSTYAPVTEKLVKERFKKRYGVSFTEENDKKIQELNTEIYNIENQEQILSVQQKTEAVKTKRANIQALEKSNAILIRKAIDSSVRELSKPDYLDHMNANITTLQNGKKMFPTINGEVINYKLSLWTSYKIKEKDGKKDTIFQRHYLPISVFTKVSGNYSDSSAGPSDDATSYFGAPLTLRFAPAVELFPGKLRENRLFVGLNTDMRLLTIGDTIRNKLQATWGVYASGGISYLGRGYAFDGDEETDASGRHEGVWSFTAMLYFFKSGGEYSKAIFGNYEKKTLTGVEMLLRFKTSKKEDAKFNFLIGASNCFTKGAANTGGWQFRLGIGN